MRDMRCARKAAEKKAEFIESHSIPALNGVEGGSALLQEAQRQCDEAQDVSESLRERIMGFLRHSSQAAESIVSSSAASSCGSSDYNFAPMLDGLRERIMGVLRHSSQASESIAS
eukprot:GHVU01000971.1.p3 GENE.GHVU01000971.1~~GHVU01000971.1.p3  ORF type:complete len:115 (+),score=24.28 GHVU01000971.1:915-1259(+)